MFKWNVWKAGNWENPLDLSNLKIRNVRKFNKSSHGLRENEFDTFVY